MPSLTTRQLPGRAKRQAAPEGQLQPGTTLQNRYQIVGILGVGGMGSVYQARDLRFPSVTKLCAVKEMMIMAADPQIRQITIQNFEREANILATLDHPAIPEIFDFFSEDKRSYLVMEFISGKSLEEIMETTEGFLSEKDVLDWAIQISEVLSYLHNHSPNPIVFRDLKPSNIMLDLHGRIRMVDFGIAKIFQAGERGTMIGTEGYSPPEQYRGEAGTASDVYALGATLHALLSKQDPRLEPPFSFAERPIRRANPDIGPAFEAIIMKALAYNVEDRFLNGDEMSKALRLLIDQTPLETRPQERLKARTEQFAAVYKISPDNVIPLWSFKCEDEIRSTPCVKDGKVYIGAYDNNLYAINIESGSFAWKFATKGGVASSPINWRGTIIFGSEDGFLYCVSEEDGERVWQFKTDGRIYCSPRAEFGHVFFGSDDEQFYAVNVTTGKLAWKTNIGSKIRSSVAIGEDLLYFGSEDGTIHSIAMDGSAKWRYMAKRGVTSSPVLVEGLVIVGSQDWSIYAIDATTGWSVWRYRTRRSVISSPSAYKGTVYIGSADNNLYAIDLNSGQKRWSYEAEGQITSSPIVYNDAVFFGGIDNYVYSLDAQNGDLRWRFQSNGPVPGSPVAVQDLILIGSTDGFLYALPA
ncbi:MAG: PQQ-binding-like beta-propeller repeat protein [Anaerolineales bacterium]|nr:PQQ-binding-like beta-propeller repeat protein [Anaerolineales bacterium]